MPQTAYFLRPSERRPRFVLVAEEFFFVRLRFEGTVVAARPLFCRFRDFSFDKLLEEEGKDIVGVICELESRLDNVAGRLTLFILMDVIDFLWNSLCSGEGAVAANNMLCIVSTGSLTFRITFEDFTVGGWHLSLLE